MVLSDWDLMLTQFRSLGGIAENIIQKRGENGRGLFPKNIKLKSRIFVPKNLLFARKYIYLDRNKVRIKKDSPYSKEQKEFFSNYQDNFSWGGGGKEEVEAFEQGLTEFPKQLKNILKEAGIIDIFKRHNKPWEKLIFERFYINRSFLFKNRNVVAPILELINHSPLSSQLLEFDEGISHPDISISEREITHHYNYISSLERWKECGFFCEEKMAFSLPIQLKIPKSDLILYCKGMSLDCVDLNVAKQGNLIVFDGIPIANINIKDFPINFLSHLLSELKINIDSKKLLEQIKTFNLKKRTEIISKIIPKDNLYQRRLILVLTRELALISMHNKYY